MEFRPHLAGGFAASATAWRAGGDAARCCRRIEAELRRSRRGIGRHGFGGEIGIGVPAAARERVQADGALGLHHDHLASEFAFPLSEVGLDANGRHDDLGFDRPVGGTGPCVGVADQR